MTNSLLLCCRAATALAISAIAIAAHAKTFTVDRFDDVVASTCDDSLPADCSLRGAITAANALPGPDTIILPAGTYTLTIPSTDEDNNANGDLDITDALTIVGDGADTTIVQACAIVAPATTCTGINRVFDVDPGAKGIEVTIRGITIRNGFQAAYADYSGGGLRNRGRLTIVDSVIRDNTSGSAGAIGTGGGVSNGGTLTLINTTVTNNRTNDLGGGIVNQDGATLVLIDSAVSFNTSFGGGGGIWSGFFDVSNPSNTKVIISRSAILNNSGGTGSGGGINSNRGTLTLTDSTVSGNSVGSSGGGIFFGNAGNGPNFLTNCTISGNTNNRSGGGIATAAGSSAVILNNCTIANNLVTSIQGATTAIGGGVSGTFQVANSLIAHNVTDTGIGPDCAGTLNSNGHNLIGNQANCAITGNLTGNVVGVDAKLGVLADNGGPTLTQAPAVDSPAIDHGNPAPPGSGGFACSAFDQRAFPRPLGAACDIGAVERNGALAITRILPAVGGNAGSVTALVSGSAFADGSTVKLTRLGQADIAGNPVQVDEGGSVIAATFDLTNASPGTWNVVVVEPNTTSVTLPNGFTVQAGGGPDLWVDVATFIIPRHDSSRLTIFYGNRGNVDAVAVPLQLSVSSQYGVTALFDIAQPPSQPDQVLTDFSQVPFVVQPVPAGGYANVPLMLPVVPAGFTGMLQITLVAPPFQATESTLFLNIDTPFFSPSLNSQILSTLVQGAMAYAPVGLGVDISPSIVPFLQQYLTNQLQLVVSRGRSAFVASLGTLPPIYSQAQLQIDAAIVGAVRTLQP